MDLKKYRQKLIGNKEERAVSPVIGVILMVAITVILAAVIAAFVLDMGDSMGNTAPQSNYNWDQTDSAKVVLEHTGGDSVNTGELTISVSGTDADDSEFAGDWSGDEISAGDSITIPDETNAGGSGITSSDISSGDTVQLIWEADDGNSQVLTEYELN